MKYLKWLFTGEFLFAIFLLSGTFKGSMPGYIPDITILLFVLTFIIAIKRVLLGQMRIYKVTIIPVLSFLLLVAIAFMSMGYSPSELYAEDKMFRLATVTTWSFLGGFILFRNSESIKRFLFGFIALSIVMAVDVLVRKSAIGLLFQESIASTYLTLAQITTTGLIILLGLFLFSDKRKGKYLLLMGILAIPIIQSGARSPVLILVIVIVVLLVSFVKVRKADVFISKKVQPLFLMLFVMTLFFAGWILQGKAETLLYRFEVMFTEDGGGASVSERTMRLSTAREMISDNFFIGQGVGSFPIYFSGVDVKDYPHNTFVEIFAELGVFALFLYLIINLFALRSVYWDVKHNGLNEINTPLILIAIFWFINTNISGSLNEDKVYFSLLSILIKLPIINNSNGSKEV